CSLLLYPLPSPSSTLFPYTTLFRSVQDPFTSYYDAQVVADFVRLVEKLGFQPVLLPFSPNGKAQHIKGFLNRFAKTAKKTADFRSEEHTSELQSRFDLVCRLLLEKK